MAKTNWLPTLICAAVAITAIGVVADGGLSDLKWTVRRPRWSFGQFTQPCRSPSYPEPTAWPSHLDLVCGSRGNSPSNGRQVEDGLRNNFCASGEPDPINIENLRRLQGLVEKDGTVSFGSADEPNSRGPEAAIAAVDRTVLRLLGEGRLVVTEAFVCGAAVGQVSSANCNLREPEFRDLILHLADERSAHPCTSVLAVMSPRHRPFEWTYENVVKLVRAKARVRVTGQLFFDSAHLPCKGSSAADGNPPRASLWEIHPIYRLEVCAGDCRASSGWLRFDEWLMVQGTDRGGVRAGGDSTALGTSLQEAGLGRFPRRCASPTYPEPAPGRTVEVAPECMRKSDSVSQQIDGLLRGNFCAVGPAAPVTVDNFRRLQRLVERDGTISFGRGEDVISRGKEPVGPPKDRTVLGLLGEGRLVFMEAFVVATSVGDGASPSCGNDKPESRDLSVQLADVDSADPCTGIIAVMSPRNRPLEWTQENVSKLVRAKAKVRITGQLFFESADVPCKDVKAARGKPAVASHWEIHPVYRFEVCASDCQADSGWVRFDEWLKKNNPGTGPAGRDQDRSGSSDPGKLTEWEDFRPVFNSLDQAVFRLRRVLGIGDRQARDVESIARSVELLKARWNGTERSRQLPRPYLESLEYDSDVLRRIAGATAWERDQKVNSLDPVSSSWSIPVGHFSQQYSGALHPGQRRQRQGAQARERAHISEKDRADIKTSAADLRIKTNCEHPERFAELIDVTARTKKGDEEIRGIFVYYVEAIRKGDPANWRRFPEKSRCTMPLPPGLYVMSCVVGAVDEIEIGGTCKNQQTVDVEAP